MPLRAINDLQRHNGPLETELAGAFSRLLSSGWYVLGSEVAAFEQAFAEYCGSSFAVGVANGTDALEMALRAVGVDRGQQVALVANAGGYGTTALGAIGAAPVYVDVDPATLSVDVKALEQALQHHDIRAVVVTHLYGRLADMEEICSLVDSAGIKLVEDCAQAHGAGRAGRRAGSWGHASCFSFYPTKNLGALGDGGMVVTSDESIAERVRQLRQYGWDRKYHSVALSGRNSRLDEVQAAILLTKLPHLDGWNARRSAIASNYRAMIRHPQVALPSAAGPEDVVHLFVVRTAQRDSLSGHLRARRVPHDVHYPVPDHRQPMFGSRFAGVSLPVTEQACNEVLTLPCFPEMTDEEVGWVAAAVNRWRS